MARKQASAPASGGTMVPAATVESIEELAALLAPVMKAIATAVGPHCEVVLHDLSSRHVDLRHTIWAIENAHVTGRSVGGPSTNLGLQVLRDEAADHDAFGYRGQTEDGRQLHCSSVYYRNAAGRVIGALCINVDLSPLQQAQTLIGSLLRSSEPAAHTKETHATDIATVLDALFEAAVDAVGKPVPMMDRADRMQVLGTLDQQGAFEIRRSVELVSRRLGISKVTAYNYLDELRKTAPPGTAAPAVNGATP